MAKPKVSEAERKKQKEWLETLRSRKTPQPKGAQYKV